MRSAQEETTRGPQAGPLMDQWTDAEIAAASLPTLLRLYVDLLYWEIKASA